jgi:hypothetical protein
MATATVKADVIDADAHVVENERVWDYLDAANEKYRPTLVSSPDNPQRQYWILDGENLGSKFPSPDDKRSEEHVRKFGREVRTPVQACELTDVRRKSGHRHRLRPRRYLERAECPRQVQGDGKPQRGRQAKNSLRQSRTFYGI